VPPIVNDGYLYFTGAGINGNVYKYTESTGSLVWSSYFQGGGLPAVNNKRVYIDGNNGIYAFDTGTGFLNWQTLTPSGYAGGGIIALYADKLITSSVVLSAETGTVVSMIGGGVQSFYGNLAVQNQTDVLSATDLTSGTIAWRFTRSGKASLAPPIIVNGTVYSLSNDGTLYAVDAKTGRLLQSLNTGGGTNSGSEYDDRYLGLAAGQGILIVPSTQTLVAYAP